MNQYAFVTIGKSECARWLFSGHDNIADGVFAMRAIIKNAIE